MANSTQEVISRAPTPVQGGKGVANRQKIVDAALNLFMERGYAETSIGDIADQAGLLKGNLSYYFKTKADMLQSVSDARMAELFGRLKALLPPDASARDSINAFIQVTQDSAHELARVGCPVGTLASQLGKTDPALQPYASRILEALQAWLQGQFAREFPTAKAQQHAEYLLTVLQGAAVMAHAFRDPAWVDRQAKLAKTWLAQAIVANKK